MYITYVNFSEMKRITCRTDIVTDRNLDYANRENANLVPLYEQAKKLLEKGVNTKYNCYYIKKSNGQKRQINEPVQELKEFMQKVVKTFTSMSGFIWPDTMYAFISGRGTKQFASLHKNARTIIHMDIKDFFHSCTFKFVVESMHQVYPFSLMDWSLLEPIIKACMLNGRLAQGAPTSPILSSIAMIPFVTEANNWAISRTIYLTKSKRGNLYKISSGYAKQIIKNGIKSTNSKKSPKIFEKKITFSIYADDIVLSINLSNSKGIKTEMCIKQIGEILSKYTPLRINHSKTRYVDIQKKGGIWVTGLMVNRDHNVTIGRKNKERLKATIFSFLADFKNNNPWNEQRVRKMMGKVSYARYIEPEFVDGIIEKYNKKLQLDYYDTIKNILYS